MNILIFISILALTAFIIWDKLLNKKDRSALEKLETELKNSNEQIMRLTIELEQKSEKLGEFKKDLEKEKSEKNEYQGKNKQMFVNITSIQEKYDSLQKISDDLKKKITQFESEKEQRTKEIEKRIQELEESRKNLEDEKYRIRKDDEERKKKEEEERDRIWNEHENVCISKMKEVCQKQEFSFTFFENTNLPNTFDGLLKPDFLIEFLGQYIVFDAKMSKSNNLSHYISEQVKKTVEKIKKCKNVDEIYPNVFFIIPTREFDNLKKVSFFEDGYTFFIIPIESFESIISSYKKVMDYDLAESFDPKERENIVNIIAAYDQHIAKQNAVNILSSMEGIRVSHLKETLEQSMKEDIAIKRKKSRIESFKPTDLKRLIHNPEEQIDEMKKLVTPRKPEIKSTDLDDISQAGLFDI